MLTGGVTGGNRLDDLVQQLAALQDPDLMPLALDVQEAIVEGNREGLLAGLDADGVPFEELKPTTYKRGREGLGPPNTPRFSASQLIDRFKCEIQPGPNGGFRIKAGWPGVKQVRFMQSGTRHMAKRNPVGIRPATRKQIDDIVAAYKRNLVARAK